MGRRRAYTGCDIFDGSVRHAGSALLTQGGRVDGVVGAEAIPAGYEEITLPGGLIAPGFVDLQVNGGGGVMLNDAPDVATIRTICEAHLPFGTTSLLPTLITDTPDKTTAAIGAARDAVAAGVGGMIGLHLEGPHLSVSRKGAHDPALIRPMREGDVRELVSAATSLPSLLLTLAPESVRPAQIAGLTEAGAIVSLGHTDSTLASVRDAAEHGASCVTHLFNAMRPLGSREPGVVGGALTIGRLSAGLIADGFHVDPATIRIALDAKQGPGKIFLVTDAMATIGTDLTEFTLNGRVIARVAGRLTLEDGTLAGAALDMISAVRFMVDRIGMALEEALRMAALYPARVLRREHQIGQLVAGARADFLLLDERLNLSGVWRAGERLS